VKLRYALLCVLVCLVVTTSGVLLGCDKPSYSSSEVIAVIKKDLYNNAMYSMEDYPIRHWVGYPISDSDWQLKYIGAGKWSVQCKVRYTFLNTQTGFKNPNAFDAPNEFTYVWVFYEKSGVITLQLTLHK